MVITDEALLAQIEAFLNRHHISPTKFGEVAANDRHFVRQLRAGRTVTLRKAQKVHEYMVAFAQEQPNGGEAA